MVVDATVFVGAERGTSNMADGDKKPHTDGMRARRVVADEAS